MESGSLGEMLPWCHQPYCTRTLRLHSRRHWGVPRRMGNQRWGDFRCGMSAGLCWSCSVMGVQVRKLRLGVRLLLRPQGLHPFGQQLSLHVVHIRWVVVDFEASMSRPACDCVYTLYARIRRPVYHCVLPCMNRAVCQYE